MTGSQVARQEIPRIEAVHCLKIYERDQNDIVNADYLSELFCYQKFRFIIKKISFDKLCAIQMNMHEG